MHQMCCLQNGKKKRSTRHFPSSCFETKDATIQLWKGCPAYYSQCLLQRNTITEDIIIITISGWSIGIMNFIVSQTMVDHMLTVASNFIWKSPFKNMKFQKGRIIKQLRSQISSSFSVESFFTNFLFIPLWFFFVHVLSI